MTNVFVARSAIKRSRLWRQMRLVDAQLHCKGCTQMSTHFRRAMNIHVVDRNKCVGILTLWTNFL